MLLCSFEKLSTPEIVLDHTSSDPYFLIRTNLFELARDFVFRFLSHRTGFEDDDICFFYIFCMRKTAVLKHCSYPCTICVIHLTSEGQDVKFHLNCKVRKVIRFVKFRGPYNFQPLTFNQFNIQSKKSQLSKLDFL